MADTAWRLGKSSGSRQGRIVGRPGPLAASPDGGPLGGNPHTGAKSNGLVLGTSNLGWCPWGCPRRGPLVGTGPTRNLFLIYFLDPP